MNVFIVTVQKFTVLEISNFHRMLLTYCISSQSKKKKTIGMDRYFYMENFEQHIVVVAFAINVFTSIFINFAGIRFIVNVYSNNKYIHMHYHLHVKIILTC